MIVNVHLHGSADRWQMEGHTMRMRPKWGSPCDAAVMAGQSLVAPSRYADGHWLHYADAIRIGVMQEPRHKKVTAYRALESHGDEFDVILTWDDVILKRPNAVRHYASYGSFLRGRPLAKKTVLITAMSLRRQAARNHYEGYRMRAAAADMLVAMGITIYGTGHTPVPGRRTPGAPDSVYPGDKWEVTAPAQFEVAVECEKRKNWWSEKILDCLVMKTVPIYRGAPNIGDFFDLRGMLIWDTIEELREIVESIQSGQIKYADFEPQLSANYVDAQMYTNDVRNCARKIAAILEIYA